MPRAQRPSRSLSEIRRLIPRGVQTAIVARTPVSDMPESIQGWLMKHNLVREGARGLRYTEQGGTLAKELQKNYARIGS